MKKMQNLAGIVLGNLIFAASITFFVKPSGVISGGTTGISLILLHYFDLPISTTTAIVNVCCFLLSILVLSWQFSLSTLLSSVLFPFFLRAMESLPTMSSLAGETLLCAITAGILSGAGVGLVIHSGASTGGLDIPILIVNKKTGVSIGTIMLLLDVPIMLTQALFSDSKRVICGLLMVVLITHVLDLVVRSGRQGARLLILSDHNPELRTKLLDAKVGLTLLDNEGGYSGKRGQAILCAVHSRRVPEIKRLIDQEDKEAFVLVSPAAEIMGKGFTIPR